MPLLADTSRVDAEIFAFWFADLALANQLGWDAPVPLLARPSSTRRCGLAGPASVRISAIQIGWALSSPLMRSRHMRFCAGEAEFGVMLAEEYDGDADLIVREFDPFRR